MMDQLRVNSHDDISVLLQGVRDGNRQSFARIVGLFQKKIYFLAYAYFRNHEDAMEILQETFLRFYQKIDLFQEGRNFQSWILQVAKNLCIDYDRKHLKRRREMEVATPVDQLSVSSEADRDREKSSDLKDVLARCLAQLAERQRTIFIMKHYNGLNYQEIAGILGISTGTVKSLHFKAVRNMRTLMSPYLGMEK